MQTILSYRFPVTFLGLLLLVILDACSPGGRSESSVRTAAENSVMENIMANRATSKFADAARVANLTEILNSPGPFTVFVPTNEAFDQLPPGTMDRLLLPENISQMQQIVRYHIIQEPLTLIDLKNADSLFTMAEQHMVASEEGDSLFINGIPVLGRPTLSRNGIIYLISRVLLPATDSGSQ